MKYVSTFTASVALLLGLAACVPEEPDTSLDTSSDTSFDLAAFHSWPKEETELTNINSFGFDNIILTDINSFGRDNIILLVDRSGSMNERSCGSSNTRSRDTKIALTTFIPTIPEDTAVGYIDFANEAYIEVAPGLHNRGALMTAAGNHTAWNSGTYLGSAMYKAIRILENIAREQNSTGTYKIVIITDGAANDQSRVRSAVAYTQNTPIEIMTAGFCMGNRHVLNDSDKTVFVSATNVDEVVLLLQQSTKAEAASFVAFTAADDTN